MNGCTPCDAVMILMTGMCIKETCTGRHGNVTRISVDGSEVIDARMMATHYEMIGLYRDYERHVTRPTGQRGGSRSLTGFYLVVKYK